MFRNYTFKITAISPRGPRMSGGNYKDNTFSPFKSMVTFVSNLIDADYLKVAYLCHMATKNYCLVAWWHQTIPWNNVDLILLLSIPMQSHRNCVRTTGENDHLELYMYLAMIFIISLPWRHNGRDSVSNHQPHDCLLNRLFRRRSKETSKLRVTGLCAGNSPGTGEFPTQMASYAENVYPLLPPNPRAIWF